MKIILSRKGFDSSSGGCPSPILPDGRMVSLPIPDKKSIITYDQINHDNRSIGGIVEQLTRGRILPNYRAHLDPDLVESSLPRRRGWRPIFGQTNQSQSHLRKNKVGEGDLFLFFGLFRHTKEIKGGLKWDKQQKRRHAIWGWMQVDEVLKPHDLDTKGYEWALDHPHFHREGDRNNTIYIAKKYLKIERSNSNSIPGAGVFTHFVDNLQLTANEGDKVSDWKLPSWFYPTEGRTPLTYHGKLSRWEQKQDHARLKCVARGQEFVLDCDEYPEAKDWVENLIHHNQ